MLEDWDDRVCPEWEQPDHDYLSFDEWLVGNKLYEGHVNQIQKLIQYAFRQVDQFFGIYKPFLTEYWENKAIQFSILEDERLKNPGEVIDALLHRFKT